MNDNTLTVGDLVTLDPRLGEPGHKGRVTQVLPCGCVFVQWLKGDALEQKEHPANLLQLHDDFHSDQTMVAFDMAAPVSWW
jgi:hypothetical protein